MPRKPAPVPLAKWLTSRNPTLRTRAETALYHYGPDAGNELFAEAEYVSRWLGMRRAVRRASVIVAIAFFALVVVCGAIGIDGNLSWVLLSLAAVVRALYDIVTDLFYRRERLKALGLALAKRNDLRGIGPLLEAWRPISLWGASRPDDDIEHELTRLLPLFLTQNSMGLRSYKKRILRRKVQRLFPYRLRQRRFAPRHALADERADLVVTLIQLLSRSTAERDLHLVARISQISAATPNDHFVRDAAKVCLTARPATPVTPPTPHPVVAPPYHAPQTPIVVKRS